MKAKPIDPKMRAAILKTGKAMQRSNRTYVDFKNLTKTRFRLIPLKPGSEQFGLPVTSFYFPGINKGTVSVATWGFKCPLLDAIRAAMRGRDKGERKRVQNIARDSVDALFGVFDRTDPRDTQVKAMRTKPSIYEALQAKILGEDDDDDADGDGAGVDITDADAGCDFIIRKVVKDGITRYKVSFLEPSALGQPHPSKPLDKQLHAAMLKAAEAFDPQDYVGTCDWSLIEQMYEEITGEAVPESYLQQDGIEAYIRARDDGDEDDERPRRAAPSPAASKLDDDDDDDDAVEEADDDTTPDADDEEADDDTTPDADDEEADDEEADDEEADDEEADDADSEAAATLPAVKSKVSFTVNGKRLDGTVVSREADADGDDYVVVKASSGKLYDVYASAILPANPKSNPKPKASEQMRRRKR